MFTLVHAVFLFAFFGPAGMSLWQLALAGISPLISHFISYRQNFIGQEEYKKTTLSAQLFAPYARVVVMHVTILFGAFLTARYGTPVYALLILTLLKTLVDLAAHLLERLRYVPKSVTA